MKQRDYYLFLPRSAKAITSLAIVVVIFISALALIGWALGIATLKSVSLQWTPMRVITALCFLMSAAALACLQESASSGWKTLASRTFGVAVSVIGLLTLASYLVELQTGQECSWGHRPFLNLFLDQDITRMSVITAILFSIFGCVLFLLGSARRRASDVAHVVLLPVAMMTYLILIGYLYNIRPFYEWLHPAVALNTDIAFCALCLATLCARPDTWLMTVFTGEEAGGVMARRLLPALLILPLVIGWFRLHGERWGIFGSEVGVALVATTYTVCFLWLVWLSARSVNRTDRERYRAEESLRQTAEELARSNKDLEQFAYVSSHDLQEPLRMVTGFMQLFEKTYGGKLDATAEKYIHYAVDGAKRMQQLINDLLAYSRTGGKAREPVPTDSRQLLLEALSNLSRSIEESHAAITTGDLPTVRADGPQLVQVFQNLVGNAIKFRGEEPPKIHVDARREGDYWVLSVTDNGIGIDPEFHNRVFIIFQRLHTKEKYAGTGIGLAICKKIVERHGGRIWVESKEGQGATFYFTLPV